jgi:hypothetical protein
MEDSFAERIIGFNRCLSFEGDLPHGVQLMNPYRDSDEAAALSESFYRKFYTDNNMRRLILGINPGRLGAGATGIPFTDTKRLEADCGISPASFHTHEPSSVFVYEVIREYGGPLKFYGDFFINSVSPLGLLIKNDKGNWVNCNYYDYTDLFKAMRSFIISNLREIASFGVDTSVCYVLGKKNYSCLLEINKEINLFKMLVALDHPRYIVQYRSKHRDRYVATYLDALSPVR